MTKVIDLQQARTERRPHIHGPARCLRCDYQWVQVQPAGDNVTGMECPKCKAMTGTMLLLVRPPKNAAVLTCHCGNQHFMLTQEHVYCLNCGDAKPLPTRP